MVEAQNILINSFNKKGLWKGINIVGASLSITHSLFVDDTLLFGSSTYQEAQSMKKFIDLYTQVSGQCINATKSKIYVFNTSQLVSQRIIYLLSFPHDHLPSTYLHVPFFMGLNKPSYWKFVIDHINKRFSAWKFSNYRYWVEFFLSKLFFLSFLVITSPFYKPLKVSSLKLKL